MMPIPAEVAARWSPMWACNFPWDRPWWRPNFSQHPTHLVYRPPMWVRCDGRYGPPFDPHEDPERIRAQLALIDSVRPIPAPLLMPGQVWIVDGAEFTVQSRAAHGRFCLVHTADLKVEDEIVVWHEDDPRVGFLVAGPTPWGRDVPWAPVAVTP